MQIIILKILSTVGIILALLTVAITQLNNTAQSPVPLDSTVFGSIAEGQGYYATSTRGLTGKSAYVAKSNSTLLGSVIIASSTATTFTLWNATSSTDVASTSFAVFKASTAEGTYTFDATLDRGLSIRTPANFVGDIIVTWK